MRMDTGNNANRIELPTLSYTIVGSAFAVFNELGYGLHEKDYQKALARELENRQISFCREVYVPITYKGKLLSRYFADFVIEEKVILELKVSPKLGYSHSRQLLNYLRAGGYRLGILLYFTEEGVKYRRVLNSNLIRIINS